LAIGVDWVPSAEADGRKFWRKPEAV